MQRRSGRAVLSAALAVACAAQVARADVPLPAGSAWVATAPRAEVFAREASAMLQSASRYAPSLAPRRFDEDLRRRTGISLLDVDAMKAAGVDAAKPWVLFERAGATYLAVDVKNRATLVRTLDLYATGRGLRGREERKSGRMRVIQWSRAQGTRPATGVAFVGERAVLMVQAAGPASSLAAAARALEGAAPVRPALEAPLLVRFGSAGPLRETWLGLKPSARGLDVSGYSLPAGELFQPDPQRAEWVRAAAGEGTGEHLGRARVLAGPLLAPFAAWPPAWLASPATADRLAEALPHGAAAGPVAWLLPVPRLQSARGAASDFQEVAHAVAAFHAALPDRSDDDAAKVLEAFASLPGAARGKAGDVTVGRGPALGARNDGGTVVVAYPADRSDPTTGASSPGRSCRKGTPVAAARVDPAALGAELRSIGLLSAMGDELRMALYAVGAAWGGLLRASLPVTAVVCQDGSRVTFDATWRLAVP